MSPALPSPRPRGSGFDGILGNGGAGGGSTGDKPWISARRRASEAKLSNATELPSSEQGPDRLPTQKDLTSSPIPTPTTPGTRDIDASASTFSQFTAQSTPPPQTPGSQAPPDLSAVQWSYVDPSGTVQGVSFTSSFSKWMATIPSFIKDRSVRTRCKAGTIKAFSVPNF